MLATGLAGIKGEYPLPAPIEQNASDMGEAVRTKLGIRSLPESLWEAITLAEDSQVLRDALGDHLFASFIRNKKIEWDSYRSEVTDYEIKRYLPIL